MSKQAKLVLDVYFFVHVFATQICNKIEQRYILICLLFSVQMKRVHVILNFGMVRGITATTVTTHRNEQPTIAYVNGLFRDS